MDEENDNVQNNGENGEEEFGAGLKKELSTAGKILLGGALILGGIYTARVVVNTYDEIKSHEQKQSVHRQEQRAYEDFSKFEWYAEKERDKGTSSILNDVYVSITKEQKPQTLEKVVSNKDSKDKSKKITPKQVQNNNNNKPTNYKKHVKPTNYKKPTENPNPEDKPTDKKTDKNKQKITGSQYKPELNAKEFSKDAKDLEQRMKWILKRYPDSKIEEVESNTNYHFDQYGKLATKYANSSDKSKKKAGKSKASLDKAVIEYGNNGIVKENKTRGLRNNVPMKHKSVAISGKSFDHVIDTVVGYNSFKKKIREAYESNDKKHKGFSKIVIACGKNCYVKIGKKRINVPDDFAKPVIKKYK